MEITQEMIKSDFDYNPYTGVLKKRMNGHTGSFNGHGYLHTRYKGHIYPLHRLIYLYMTGSWPAQLIDHINGKRTDNRWINLRAISCRENSVNSRKLPPNRLPGCYLHHIKDNGDKVWMACININKKTVNLGYFQTEIEANARYVEYRNTHNLR